ncbi:MAG: hypothetical protein SGI92_34080 [Bryobacteraceae bacterium]|nr:hypothetical protein [Bryobacteraceae bacterium]
MTTLLTVIVAGALLATGTLATATDAAFEERFRAKTGRYTQAEEARRQRIADTSENRECAMPTISCCTRNAHTQNTVAPNPPWLNVKQGRTSTTPATCTRDNNKAAAAVSEAETWHRAKYGHATNAATAVNTAGSATCCD